MGESKADEHRRQAAACMEVARRTPLEADCVLMMEMAQRWLELARQEAKP
jgi:hypothetical protein